MANFIERLRTDLIARATGLTGASDPPLDNRGVSLDEKKMPKAFVWIERDVVVDSTKPDDGEGPSSRWEIHRIEFEVGVMTKNAAAVSNLDVLVAELRERMAPPFEGKHDIEFDSVEYEDEIRTFGRPFVSASMNFHLTYTTPEGDAS